MLVVPYSVLSDDLTQQFHVNVTKGKRLSPEATHPDTHCRGLGLNLSPLPTSTELAKEKEAELLQSPSHSQPPKPIQKDTIFDGIGAH